MQRAKTRLDVIGVVERGQTTLSRIVVVLDGEGTQLFKEVKGSPVWMMALE